jgi:hypothetical protein
MLAPRERDGRVPEQLAESVPDSAFEGAIDVLVSLDYATRSKYVVLAGGQLD